MGIAGGIVTIGFTTIFITLGVIAVVLAVMHGKTLFENRSGPEEHKGADRGD